MKHRVRKLALLLVLALLLSTLALAAEPNAEIKDVTQNCTIGFNANNQSMTLKATGLTGNGMYLVLVLKGEETVPTESNILYINQATADESGTVIFDNIYPSSLVDSTVYLSGTGLDGLTKMGSIDLKVMLGDVTGDGEVKVGDATAILRYLVDLEQFSSDQIAAADVTGDGLVKVADATKILRYLVGLEGLQ